MQLPLLQQLHAIEGFHWIRILYMYPDEIDDELIEGMAGLPKVLPYFDIPMQHADRQMLERMNRRGTKEDVLKLVEKIRSTFADPTLRTTFIVGFPGENRETMDELLQFVREVRWDRMGAFTYSPEEDTPGSLMKPVCEESIKQQYLDELMKLQEQIAWENQQKKLGKVIEVLVEDKDGLTNRYRGRSAWDAPDDVDGMVIFRSDRAIEPGTFVQVRITEVLVHDVIGVEV